LFFTIWLLFIIIKAKYNEKSKKFNDDEGINIRRAITPTPMPHGLNQPQLKIDETKEATFPYRPTALVNSNYKQTAKTQTYSNHLIL